MTIKRIMLVVVLLALTNAGFLQSKVLSAGRKTVISDFEDPLDIMMWSLKIQGLGVKPPEEEARIDYESKIVARGKGAMKISKVFMLPSHEAIILQKEVNISVSDPSKDGLEFFVNPGELDLKNNYEISIFLIDDKGEVWRYRWWSTFTSLEKGWHRARVRLTELKFAWGGNGDDGDDGLIDGERIKLVEFRFSDEPNLVTGKDIPVPTAFYLDEIKYVEDLTKAVKEVPESRKSSPAAKNIPLAKESYGVNPLPELSCFETGEDAKRWKLGEGVTIKLSKEHVTQGEYSGKITFPLPSPLEKENHIVSLAPPAFEKDWSDYGMIVMDIYNPNDFVVQVLFHIPGLVWEPLHLLPSSGTTYRKSIFMPTHLLCAEERWNVDNVKTISFTTRFTHDPNRAYALSISKIDKVNLFVDNIKLLTKEETRNFIDRLYPIEPTEISMEESPERVLLQSKKGGKYIPVQERDFNFMPFSTAGRTDEVVIQPLFEELGFFRLGRGPVIVPFTQGCTTIDMKNGWDIDLKSSCVPHFKHLSERKLPFFITIFGWDMLFPHEVFMERVRKLIGWADEIGKEHFLGINMFETSAAIGYYFPAVTNAATRLEKANNYIKVVKRLREEIRLPDDKLLMVTPSALWPEELCYEAGAEISLREVYCHWNNLGPIISHMRGNCRSFNKKYGTCVALDPPPTRSCYPHMSWAKHYDSRTLRYITEKEENPPGRREYYEERIPDDLFKFYIWSYYQGSNYLTSREGTTLVKGNLTDSGKRWLKFLDFVDNNERGKDIVTEIAIVRSKGCVWGGAKHYSLKDLHNNPTGLGNYPYGKEEADYIYLNSFFPDFSDNAVLSKMLWTGTPYGAVDIIYPSMKLSDMKRYASIIFLGYNRMDSVRVDFLDDLMNYVKDGGIVLLSMDQLKDIKDELDMEKLDNFLGIEIGSEKKKIKDYIKVIGDASFKIDKKEYAITSMRELYRGEKEGPWVYKIMSKEAKVIAKDARETPILLLNKYGKGYIFLFTTPTLSMIPGEKGKPFERSKFVEDVIDKICRYKGLPIDISPKNDNVEFLISRTANKEATIFIMNHGPDRWHGDIAINLKEAGLNKGVRKNVSAKVVEGYNSIKDSIPEIEERGGNLIIKGITIEGDTKKSCAFRQAKFVLIKLCG